MNSEPVNSCYHNPDQFGRELEACRSYLTLVAERSIPELLRPKLTASDLVQETFVDAHRRSRDLRAHSIEELRAWLYGIMLLNLAEQKRKYLTTAKTDVRREVRLEAPGTGHWPMAMQVADNHPTPSTQVIQRDQLSRLADALAKLPELERRVILWRYQENLSFQEIGTRIGGRTADAARMLFNRSCHRLSRMLGGEGP